MCALCTWDPDRLRCLERLEDGGGNLLRPVRRSHVVCQAVVTSCKLRDCCHQSGAPPWVGLVSRLGVVGDSASDVAEGFQGLGVSQILPHVAEVVWEVLLVFRLDEESDVAVLSQLLQGLGSSP